MSERAGESKDSREEGKGEEDLDLGGGGGAQLILLPIWFI